MADVPAAAPAPPPPRAGDDDGLPKFFADSAQLEQLKTLVNDPIHTVSGKVSPEDGAALVAVAKNKPP